MNVTVIKSIEILEKTPSVLIQLLTNLSEEYTHTNEGAETWSVYDVIGHLIHGEQTDWMIRVNIILNGIEPKKFEVFDRFAQFENSKGKTLAQLLMAFKELRNANIQQLKNLNINDVDLEKTGNHPAFGRVTLSQLLATWVVHDLNHISQITRIMAHQYKNEVGPWIEYLRILK